jgi:type I restriction enzyme, S subunit
MSAAKIKNMPALRFPEFSAPWQEKRGRELFGNRRLRGEDGVPIYSVTLNNGLVPRDSLVRQFGGDAETESHLRAKPGDLVYNMMRMWQGAVGRAPVECMVSPAYVVLAPAKDVDSGYFVYQLQRARSLYDLWAHSHGLTDDRLRLYYRDFGHIRFHVPKKTEQKKISTFIAVVEKKLDALRRQSELLQTCKRGLMQKIFSQALRFKAADGTEFPAWEVRKLRQVLVEHGDKSTGKEKVFSVSVSKGLVNQIEHLGRSFSAKDTSHYNLAKPGDVIFTKSPTGNFPFGIIKQSKVSSKVIVSPLYGVFTPETYSLGIILDAYFEVAINTNNFLKPIVQKGAKNTISISNKTFLSGALKLPVSHAEQQKIADLLAAIDAKIGVVSAQIEKMEAFKKGLLQQMFV